MSKPNDVASVSDADGAEPPVVLVVDDEERVTEAFALWLREDYDVRTANSGDEAFERLDDDVDVVLLDRHMPGVTGDEVLDHIDEEGYDCRVAMVTGVDPDLDIVDMPFDEYITKPVGKDAVTDVVEELLSLDEYSQRVRDLFAVSRKEATLESEFSESQLADSHEYARLRAERETLEDEVDATVGDLTHDDAESAFRDL